MDQRSICLFLALKKFSARAVSNELTVVFGADAIAYSTVTKYLHYGQFIYIGALDFEKTGKCQSGKGLMFARSSLGRRTVRPSESYVSGSGELSGNLRGGVHNQVATGSA
jgi:hypothetical protein